MPLHPLIKPTVHLATPWYTLACGLFWDNTDKWLRIIQIIAIVIGAFAAYNRFFRGRIYSGRLELHISGSATERDGTVYVSVVASMKNIG